MAVEDHTPYIQIPPCACMLWGVCMCMCIIHCNTEKRIYSWQPSSCKRNGDNEVMTTQLLSMSGFQMPPGLYDQTSNLFHVFSCTATFLIQHLQYSSVFIKTFINTSTLSKQLLFSILTVCTRGFPYICRNVCLM